MKILMTGGGTGGHVNPALAIANTFKTNIPSSEIAFVGTERGLENTLVPKAGYTLYHVDVRGFDRSLSIKNIRAAYLAAVSPIRARKIIKKFAPDAVIGTGGYVSWPVLVAASKMGIPTAVHESNAVPGLAIRKLVPYVDRIFTNFEASTAILEQDRRARGKIMQVGCPLMGTFGTVSREEARRLLGLGADCEKYVVSFGGSLGARRMNEAALELMKGYAVSHPGVRYVHACGADGYEETLHRFREEGLDRYPNIELVEYIYDMPLRMAAADLVISRAGAITLSELSRGGKAAILIPSPNVTDNQQYKNAKVIADGGGAVLIEERDLGEGRIVRETEALLADDARLARMCESMKKMSPPDANKRIYEEVLQLVEKNKKDSE